MKKILLTGFKPFLGESINPSEMIVKYISSLSFHDVKVETLVLPVEFIQAPAILSEKVMKEKYDYVLMLGQAGGRGKINLERVALNWIETESPDEVGFKPSRGPIDETQVEVIFTEVDLAELKEQLLKKNIPTEVSLSAGGYVCNYLYYSMASLLQGKSKILFVHVPYLPEQVVNKTNMPSMTLEQMQEAVLEILKYFKEN